MLLDAALAQELKSNRLIQLFVAANAQPYLIQESDLEQASEYFAKAIKHENWGVDQTGKLHFPDDDEQTFKILVYFVANKTLPAHNAVYRDAAAHQMLIDCWVLADKYLMRDLQDLLMIEIMFGVSGINPGWETIRYAFEKGPRGSKIWKLFAEEAVWQGYGYPDDEDPKKLKTNEKRLEELDKAMLGIPGALCEILKVPLLSYENTCAQGRLKTEARAKPYLYGSVANNPRLKNYAKLIASCVQNTD